MCPQFSKEERLKIRESLLNIGYELFTRQGLKKTTLDDLTRPLGIHKTSFYSFYESKEELYLDLLLQEAPKVRSNLEKYLNLDADVTITLIKFLRAIINELEENQLVKRLVSHPEELMSVTRKVRPKDIEEKKVSLLPIEEFIKSAQIRNAVLNVRVDVIVGVIRAVSMVTLHRKDIGEDIYEEVVDLLISSVSKGLTK